MKKFFVTAFISCLAAIAPSFSSSAYDASSQFGEMAGIPVKDDFSIKCEKLPRNVVFTSEISSLDEDFSAEITSCPDEWTVLSYDADKLRVKLVHVTGGLFDLFRTTAKIKIKPLAAGKGTVVIRSGDKTVTFIIQTAGTKTDGE